MINTQSIYERLKSQTETEVVFAIKCFRDGNLFKEESKKILFSNFKKELHVDIEFEIEDQSELGIKNSSFLEISINSIKNLPIFTSRSLSGVGNYNIYYKNGKKSFLLDAAYKIGSPPVIQQIAFHKMYLDAYPVIDLNIQNDLGESLVFINPYPKPILAKVITMDRREIKRIKINALTCKEINLNSLLADKTESKWKGHIQITANNRVIVYNLKHSFKNSFVISDVEHLDPYRGELNFLPLTQYLRFKLGNYLKNFKF